MDLLELLKAQLTDPFRIGLLVALLMTMLNTARTTGQFVPLILGAVFVAVLIPTAFQSQGTASYLAIAVGMVSNAILLAVGLGVIAAWRRVAKRT